MPTIKSSDLPAELQARLGVGGRKSKYNAKAVIVDGIRFQSTKEADFYVTLKNLVLAGQVIRFHRQVIFDLPGGVKYLCDFMVVYADGRIEYIEVKGVRTATYILKKKQVEAIYGAVITEV